MLRDARPPRAAAAAIALAAALVSTLLAASTRAAPGERVALRWTAPPGCPAGDAVRAEVDRLLGPAGAHPPSPIEVTAAVSRDDGGAWRVHLETLANGTTRVRDVHGATCAVIADATALILALMIDPAAVTAASSTPGSAPEARERPPAAPGSTGEAKGSSPAAQASMGEANGSLPGANGPSGEAKGSSPTAQGSTGEAKGSLPGANGPSGEAKGSLPGANGPSGEAKGSLLAAQGSTGAANGLAAATTGPVRPATKAPPGADRPRSSTPIAFGAGAWVGLDGAPASGFAAAFGARGILGYGAQRFELGVVFHPARSVAVPTRPDVGGNIDLLAGAVGTCRNLVDAPIELGPCAGFELGRLHAVGYGVTTPGEASTLWAALAGGGALIWRLGTHVGLAVRLDGVVPLQRPRFTLDNVGAVFKPPPLTARGSAGVEIVF